MQEVLLVGLIRTMWVFQAAEIGSTTRGALGSNWRCHMPLRSAASLQCEDQFRRRCSYFSAYGDGRASAPAPAVGTLMQLSAKSKPKIQGPETRHSDRLYADVHRYRDPQRRRVPSVWPLPLGSLTQTAPHPEQRIAPSNAFSPTASACSFLTRVWAGLGELQKREGQRLFRMSERMRAFRIKAIEGLRPAVGRGSQVDD